MDRKKSELGKSTTTPLAPRSYTGLPEQVRASLDRYEAERQVGLELKAAFEQEQQALKDAGKCGLRVVRLRNKKRPDEFTIVDPSYHHHRDQYVATLCDRDVYPGEEVCREHYVSDVLHVSPRGNGSGVASRPFKPWQVPLGRMSEVQKKLWADVEKLPMEKSYEECLAAANELDPSHPLEPIYQKPQKTPRRSRQKVRPQ